MIKNMKTTRIMAMAALMTATLTNANAQLNGNGYYRVLNAETERYLTLTNDRLGNSLAAAFTALVTVRGFDNVVNDPASILYIRSAGGNNYDIVAQGVDSYVLAEGYHVKIASAGSNTYNCYASDPVLGVVSYYLGDNVKEGSVKSQADTDGSARKWYILPVNTEVDKCFGFKPEVDDNSGYYYTTCYASFPFRPVDDIKVYYVDEMADGYALMREITGDVPAATPVIIRCSSKNPSQNRAMPLASSSASVSGNLLSGVYFNKTTSANPNYTPYDMNTMRVIGETSGDVAMTTSNIFRLPANKAYLPVTSGEADNIRLITHEEYEKLHPEAEKPVTVTAYNVVRYYGEENPSLAFTTAGGTLKGMPEVTCEATATSPVGEYPITFKTGTVTNNQVTFVEGTLTVLPARLSARLSDAHRLEGQDDPEWEFTYSGFVNNEDESVITTKPTVETTATKDSPAGVYEAYGTGGEAANYEFAYNTATFEVYSKTITANSYTREYGEENPAFDYSPVQPKGTPELSCKATEDSPVGTYTILLNQGTIPVDGIEYVEGTLTITPAELTVTVADEEIEMGEEIPAFKLSYEGWKNGEDESVLDKKPTATTEATAESAMGDYPITISGGEAKNYTFRYIPGNLHVKESSGIANIEADGKIYDVYTLGGQLVARKKTVSQLPEGVYLLRSIAAGSTAKAKKVVVSAR